MSTPSLDRKKYDRAERRYLRATEKARRRFERDLRRARNR